jgi:hypothetical protein
VGGALGVVEEAGEYLVCIAVHIAVQKLRIDLHFTFHLDHFYVYMKFANFCLTCYKGYGNIISRDADDPVIDVALVGALFHARFPSLNFRGKR